MYPVFHVFCVTCSFCDDVATKNNVNTNTMNVHSRHEGETLDLLDQ